MASAPAASAVDLLGNGMACEPFGMAAFLNALANLRQAIANEPKREGLRSSNANSAHALVSSLPLVHVTGREGTDSWSRICASSALKAATTQAEERSCGWDRAVYFFLGSAAYPKGRCALLLTQQIIEQSPSSFSPFDSGALSGGHAWRDNQHWPEPERTEFLREHSGLGRELPDFAKDYIASHFEDVKAYVERPQISDPDLPPHHG